MQSYMQLQTLHIVNNQTKIETENLMVDQKSNGNTWAAYELLEAAQVGWKNREIKNKSEEHTLSRKDFLSDQEVRWSPGCGDYAILAQTQKQMPTFGRKRE